MQYNFDEVLDRTGNFAAKYDEREKKFGTMDVIPLWVADMDFRTAQPVIDAMQRRLDQGIFGYTSRPDSYFEAICSWQERRHGWKIPRELVSFCPGVVPALSVCIKNLTEPGDLVLIQTPVYSEFYDIVEAAGRRVLENPLVQGEENRYTIDFEDLEQKLSQGPKLFLLCSPHNPVGRVWTREELIRMTDLCARYGVPIVSDEIHSDLVFFGNRHIPTASISQDAASRTITCISGTKTFNLAGLQAAAVVFPNAGEKGRFDSFWQGLDLMRNNCFSLVAMEAAFREGEEWLEQLLSYLEGNLRFVREFCDANIPRIRASLPEATYLVWLDCRDLGMDNAELRRFMIEKAGLGLNEGWTFGHSLTGFMRLNAACPRAVLHRALTQLMKAVRAL